MPNSSGVHRWKKDAMAFFMLTNIQIHESGNSINPQGGNSVQAVPEEQGQQLQKAA